MNIARSRAVDLGSIPVGANFLLISLQPCKEGSCLLVYYNKADSEKGTDVRVDARVDIQGLSQALAVLHSMANKVL